MTKKKQGAAPANKTKPKKKVIGVDPLAWLSGDEDEQSTEVSENIGAETQVKVEQTVQENNPKPAQELATESSQPEASQDEAPIVISLGSCLEIREVQRLLDELRQTLNSDRAIHLDGSEIEKADTAGLQLITAFYQSAEAQGIPVEWNKPSETLQRSAAQIGLSAELRL